MFLPQKRTMFKIVLKKERAYIFVSSLQPANSKATYSVTIRSCSSGAGWYRIHSSSKLNIHTVCRWIVKSDTCSFNPGCSFLIRFACSFTSAVECPVNCSLNFSSDEPCERNSSNSISRPCLLIIRRYSSVVWRR